VEQFNRKCYERSLSQLVTGNTAEMRIIVATLLKNSSSHSLRGAVMVQGLSSVSLDYYTINEMKTRFTDLHARAALGLQLVPSVMTMLPKLEDFSFL
jgi:hypothetical protein